MRQAGDETFRICREVVDEIILVTTTKICAAIRDVFEDTRAIMEPAGALAVAGIKRYVAEQTGCRDQTLVAINSGANMNFDRLRYIAERAGSASTARRCWQSDPRAARQLPRFCETIGNRYITEFNYRIADPARAPTSLSAWA